MDRVDDAVIGEINDNNLCRRIVFTPVQIAFGRNPTTLCIL